MQQKGFKYCHTGLCFLAPRKCAQQALLLRTTRGCQKHRRLNLIDPSRSLTTGRPGHLSGLAGRHSRWLKGGLVGSLLHSLRFNSYAEPLPPLSWRGLSELRQVGGSPISDQPLGRCTVYAPSAFSRHFSSAPSPPIDSPTTRGRRQIRSQRFG